MVVNLAVLVAVLVYYPRIPAGQRLMQIAAILILAGVVALIVALSGPGVPAPGK
jgi:hypothetical protein